VEAKISDRCHIVVFNYDRICSLINNFDRIRNFRDDRDRLIIFDSSSDPRHECDQLDAFARVRGFQYRFVRRRNWGIDQGGRLEYFALLIESPHRPTFVWQFQEHFLDHDSPYSRWPTGTRWSDGADLGGQLKGDTIADGVVIDLDHCQRLFEAQPDLGVVYAARLGIGVFETPDGFRWFWIDGANFCVRTSLAVQTFNRPRLDQHHRLYDGSYSWALFMEWEWGRLLTESGCAWHDLVSSVSFKDHASLCKIAMSAPRLKIQWDKLEHWPTYYRHGKWILPRQYNKRFDRFLPQLGATVAFLRRLKNHPGTFVGS
jgi:hypothetical protein